MLTLFLVKFLLRTKFYGNNYLSKHIKFCSMCDDKRHASNSGKLVYFVFPPSQLLENLKVFIFCLQKSQLQSELLLKGIRLHLVQ